MPANLLRVAACAGLLALLPVILAVYFLALRPHSASAVIFVVNSTGDQSDLVPGDGICLTGGATCTLRAAIQESNALAGADIVNFLIPGVGPHTIAPASPLPVVTQSVMIDGYSQPGASANTNPTTAGSNAVLTIELSGASAGAGADGLVIAAAGSTLKGLVINRFSGSGIELTGSGTGRTVEGNFIGTDLSGLLDQGNGAWGVLVLGASNSTIGGTAPAARNVISGNETIGIEVCCSGSSGAAIQGNLIGTDKTGTADLGNTQWGILLNTSPNNTIGGAASGARNVISGNNTIGIEIVNPQATGNIVQGNYIGTDVTGGVDIGNGTWGILVNNAPNNTFGGTSAGARNVISGNDRFGIEIVAGLATGNIMQGNYIGTDATGTVDVGNTSGGVFVNAAPTNTIGGTAGGAGNVISGNDAAGLTTNSTSNVVQGNYIGTDATGSTGLGNSGDGLDVFGANNTIGGTAGGARNVISGNEFRGIQIAGGFAVTGNVVEGNYIGTDSTGTADLGNSLDGVLVWNGASNNTIGGTNPGARNVISGNAQHGVWILADGTGNLVQGNYIGTDATGSVDLGNAAQGVFIQSTSGHTIGGTVNGARNVVSGNDSNGILIYSGGLATNGNVVQGNYIGTDAGGTADLGNSSAGVRLEGSLNSVSNNTIGGTNPGARNIISGNDQEGVIIVFGLVTGNIVQGNYIGMNATGSAAVGNSFNGVHILLSSNNTVGGSGAGSGNLIGGNLANGVSIIGNAATGNQVRGNAINSNGQLGINLDGSGVAANDPGDTDAGGNDLQNFPVLTSAASGGGSTTIAGSLNSTPNSTFDLDFYSSPICDPSTFGEGQTYLGSSTQTTDGSGNVSFSVTVGTAVSAGDQVTATATNSGSSTSEFSQCVAATLSATPPPSGVPTPSPTPSPTPCPTNCPTPSPTPCATNCPPTPTPSPAPCPTNCPITPTPTAQPSGGGPNPVGGIAGLSDRSIADGRTAVPSDDGAGNNGAAAVLVLLAFATLAGIGCHLQYRRRSTGTKRP